MFNACNNNVLSKGKMIKLLTEIHTLEGAFEASSTTYSNEDKEQYFNALFEKHKTSSACFDSSLVWYTAKPNEFEKICDAVAENLKKLEADVKKYKYHPIYREALQNSKSELWENAGSIILSSDTSLTDTTFKYASFVVKDTELRWKDVYQLNFIERVSPSDSTQNLHAVLRIHYRTGLIDSARIELHADSLKRRYKVKMPANEMLKIDSLTANFFVYDYISENYKVQIDSIKLVRNYNSLIQDSIENVISKMDTFSIDTIAINKPLLLKEEN
jgi:hypothetical protein